MDDQPKPLQQRKEQRVVRRRRLNPRPQVRLTPTDILKLLPQPIVLPDRSLAAIERQLSHRRERLERAMKARLRQDFVPQPRHFQMPSTVRLEGLLEQIETLPTRRKCLTRAEFRVYLDTLLRVRNAIVTAIRKIRQSRQRDYQQRYLARVGQIFLDAPANVLEKFIVGRRPGRKQPGREWRKARLSGDAPSSGNHRAAPTPSPAVSFSSEAPPPASGSA